MPRGRKPSLPRLPISESAKKTLKIFDPQFHTQLQQNLFQRYRDFYSSLLRLHELSMKQNLQEAAEEVEKKNDRLLSLQEAWRYLRKLGVEENYKSFAGKVARGTIPGFLFSGRWYVLKSELDFYAKVHSDFVTINELYRRLKAYWPHLKYRSFVGRVEKGSIPSVKLFGKRLISKEVAEALEDIAKNYMSVPEAYAYLRNRGITIRRNAFERRMDRGLIPFVKVGGRRYIPKEVVEKLAEWELGRKK